MLAGPRWKIGRALALVLLGAALGAAVGDAFAVVEPPPGRARPVSPEGLAQLHRVVARPPETAEPYLRAWWAHRDANLGIAYAVVPRRVPMHVHLDADHVLLVLEGWAHVTLGGAKMVLGRGDLVAVPRGMAHDIARGGVERLLVLDVSTPRGDMAQTFWIEDPNAPQRAASPWRAPSPSPAAPAPARLPPSPVAPAPAPGQPSPPAAPSPSPPAAPSPSPPAAPSSPAAPPPAP